jgi:hypothetical protein
MKFYYGTDKIYSDITKLVFAKCIKFGEIFIPASDNLRNKLFSDPIKGVIKHIKVVDNFGNSIIFDIKKPINIENENFNLSEYVFYRTPIEERKYWWNKKGRFIDNKDEQLSQLQNLLKIENGILGEKKLEQLMVISYINKDDIVLEIGANIGQTSLFIASMLENENNLVSIDSNPDHIKKLNYNKKINEMDFITDEVAITSKELIQKRSETKVSNLILPGFFKINTINWKQFQTKYNKNFNVLFVHCGYILNHILDDEPDFFMNFKKIFIVNDFKDILEKNFVDKNLRKSGFRPFFTRSGGKGICKDFYYQFWIKEVIELPKDINQTTVEANVETTNEIIDETTDESHFDSTIENFSNIFQSKKSRKRKF